MTLTNDAKEGAAVKLVYQVGGFFEDGLQFTLLLRPQDEYEAHIIPVSVGNIVSSGRTRFDTSLTAEWNGTSYMYLIEPL